MVAAAAVPSPAFKFSFYRGSKTHHNLQVSCDQVWNNSQHTAEQSSSLPFLTVPQHPELRPGTSVAGAAPCIDYSTTQQEKHLLCLTSSLYTDTNRTGQLESVDAHIPCRGHSVLKLSNGLPVSGLSTISHCLAEKGSAVLIWNSEQENMDTGQQPSILLWISVFPHSFLIPVVDAPKQFTCKILRMWPSWCPCKAVLGKVPTFSKTSPGVSQPSYPEQTTFIRCPTPQVCIDALHLILISSTACTCTGSTCTGSHPLWDWPPQFQFDKITCWGNMSLIVPTVSYFLYA